MVEEQTKYGNIHNPSVTEDLLSACERMIEITGGSENWNGETHKALKKIEAAIARAKKEEEVEKNEEN